VRILAILLSLISTAAAATWDQLPLVSFLHELDAHFVDVNVQAVEKDFGALHPWKAGNALPTSFNDAGLKQPVHLVSCDIYFDGGSHYYLFRGANGKYLVLCTDPGSYGSSDAKKCVRVDKPRLFLGALHFTDKSGVVVPFDSDCERFLLAVIKSEVERINKLPLESKQVPNQLPDPTSPSVTRPAVAGRAPLVTADH
jgi:hypothetical protein